MTVNKHENLLDYLVANKCNDLISNGKIGIEKEIKTQLDSLQFLNEDIVDLTIMYEAMLHRLCEITGVQIPSEMDQDTPPEDTLH